MTPVKWDATIVIKALLLGLGNTVDGVESCGAKFEVRMTKEARIEVTPLP